MKYLLTGARGMDASHAADILVERGHEVHGVLRRYANPQCPNIQHLIDKEAITLHEADMSDSSSLTDVLARVKPDYVLNLAAQSHVQTSFAQPEFTLDVTAVGAWRVLEAVRRTCPKAHVYQASSSEIYGDTGRNPKIILNEDSPKSPVSPYGIAKLAAHHLARMYRNSYGLHASSGILFNHESQRRGNLFLTRKVTLGLARIAHGVQKRLELGNLDAIRDWGYAPEYVDGMLRMLDHEEAGEWVLATGEGHSVREWVDEALEAVNRFGFELDWSCIQTVPGERRPHDIARLVGDPKFAKRDLGWEAKTKFRELVGLMVSSDLALAAKEAGHE